MSALAKRAELLAERTSDAYSADAYGAQGWRGCCLLLLRRGYSEREAEAILRSKWTRLAGDGSKHRYGHFTGADLGRFLDYSNPITLRREVAELVLWTVDSEPERDDAYERAAARARSNDFEDTNGKDWT